MMINYVYGGKIPVIDGASEISWFKVASPWDSTSTDELAAASTVISAFVSGIVVVDTVVAGNVGCSSSLGSC